MDILLGNLKQKKIISPRDIQTLRIYIEKKYPTYAIKKRAEILANAIHKIMDDHLRGFQNQNREKVKEQLLKKAVLQNQHSINYADIFQICMEWEDQDSTFIEDIALWVNQYSEQQVTMEEIYYYVQGKREEEVEEKIEQNLYEEEQNFSKEEMKIKIEEEEQTTQTTENHQPPKVIELSWVFKKYSWKLVVASLVFIVFLSGFTWKRKEDALAKERSEGAILSSRIGSQKVVEETTVERISSQGLKDTNAEGHLLDEIAYREIDRKKLNTYLGNRKSLLAEEPYFSTILRTAREFNINPMVIFAIAGQEQSFVPKNHSDAKRIANNPYNVHHSWKKYNTDIGDASQIVSRTIIRLSQGKPRDMDVFRWINRRYAEDKQWWKGVRSIYDDMEKNIR